MKEYQLTVREHLAHGLLPSESLPDDLPYWLQIFNLAPGKFGMERAELVTPSVHREGQIFSTSEMLIVFYEDLLTIYGLMGDIIATERVGFGPWDCVAIGPFMIAMNGDVIVTIDPATQDITVGDERSGTPCGRTLCQNNGQLVIGNIVSDWRGCGANSIAYSRIGDIDCTVDHSNEAGFINLPTSGAIQKVVGIGPNVVVCTEDGIFYLSPPQELPGFAVTKVYEKGLLSKRAAASDPRRAILVTTDGVLSVGRDGAVAELGFTQYFCGDAEVIYGEKDNTFYITTNGKTYCLIENELFEHPQVIHSVARWKSERLGVVSQMGEHDTWQFATHSLTMDNNSMKTLRSVEFLGTLPRPQEAFCRVHWKTNMSNWVKTAWKPLLPEPMVVPNISGVKFRIEMRGKFSQQEKLQISKLTGRYKTTDRRFIRGATGATGT